MQLTPEIKAQLAEQKAQCIFCKIISKEMEGKIVFDDEKTIAVMDINPAMKGHTLFMLKEHYPIMPYIQPDEFVHYFGLLPQLCKAVKDAILTPSINIFIANGGIAGQQSPHFLLHLFPREKDDGFFNFLFKLKEKSLSEEQQSMLQHNFPLMMANHFKRSPAQWHKGAGEIPDFLKAGDTILYEDEQVLVTLPNKSLVPGHITIYSKLQQKFIEKLSVQESAHLFYVASYAATAVFEGLQAQGTNIIMKSGECDDNPNGQLIIHVLPRFPGDGLDKLLWKGKQEANVDGPAGKIKGKTWKIAFTEKEEVKKDVVKAEVVKIGKKKLSGADEVSEAIKRFQ